MSTIAARAHSSAVLTAPAKRAGAQRAKSSRLVGVARLIGRRPGRSLTFVLFAGAAGVILSNALFFQKMRHPAPMLSAPQAPHARAVERKAEPAQAAAPAPVAPAQAAAAAPVPPTRPSALAQPVREAQPRPPAAVTSVPRTAAAPPAPAAAPRTAAAPRDPIADLINGDMRPPGDIRGVATAKSSTPRRTAEN